MHKWIEFAFAELQPRLAKLAIIKATTGEKNSEEGGALVKSMDVDRGEPPAAATAAPFALAPKPSQALNLPLLELLEVRVEEV